MKTLKAYDYDGCGAVTKTDMRKYLRVKLGHEAELPEEKEEKIAPSDKQGVAVKMDQTAEEDGLNNSKMA